MRSKNTHLQDLSLLTKAEVGYVAGLLERASFTLNKTGLYKFDLRLTISFVDKAMMDWLQKKVGGGLRQAFDKNLKRRFITFKWVLTGVNTAILISKCYPHLKIKREQANILFMYAETQLKENYIYVLDEKTNIRRRRISEEQKKQRVLLRDELINVRAKSKTSIYEEVKSSKLFDFIDSSDGFGPVLREKEKGFFDDFINSLYEQINS